MNHIHSTFDISVLSEDEQARLLRLLPIRVVLRRYADGTMEGLTEESWNLNWSSNRINIFWSGKAYSILGETTIDGVADAEHHCHSKPADLFTPQEMVVDPMASDSPIAIDWKRWLHAKNKYDKRNAHFTVRGAT